MHRPACGDPGWNPSRLSPDSGPLTPEPSGFSILLALGAPALQDGGGHMNDEDAHGGCMDPVGRTTADTG